jgi:deoxyribose-phosphate aldolase
VPVKVILETHYLTDDEIRRGCALCVKAGAKYVKTSTGWAETGATLENVALIASCIDGKIGIKAAGGIRDLDMLLKMYRLGVRRFGINLAASVDIVRACQALPGGCVELN